MRKRQHTLKNAIHCSGVGLHCGLHATMTLRPAPVDHGIVFRRVDLPDRPEIPALWSHAIETPLCSTIARDSVQIATVEHLMAALIGCGVDNAVVEIDGAEVPIMDGSAAPFVFLIECAGTVAQEKPRRALRVLERIEVQDPNRRVAIAPAEGMQIRFEIQFESAVIREQVFDGTITETVFKQAIARARTFGFLHEVAHLRAAGLARGGSLENAVVIDGDLVLNEGGLRFADEFVRHKVLDSLGDLYLAGAPIIGRFEGIRAGHALTLRLLRELFARPSAWRWMGLDGEDGSLLDSEPLRLAAQGA